MDNKLIESALQLTGKKMDDISEYVYNKFEYCYELDFSIEKFCYYLLSPSFIEKYTKINHRDFIYTSQDI